MVHVIQLILPVYVILVSSIIVPQENVNIHAMANQVSNVMVLIYFNVDRVVWVVLVIMVLVNVGLGLLVLIVRSKLPSTM